ncbi:hypothetical protein PTKIN_Ptkin11bG0194800 [Pterospermum kingtungense]
MVVGRRCKKPEAFIPLVRKIAEEASGFGIFDLFPSVKLFLVISGKKAKLEKLHPVADEVLENIIEEHRASNANMRKGEDVTDDLVGVLLSLQDHGGLEFPLTDNNIKAVILDMLQAGTETSTTKIEWAMFEMMKIPMVMEKAQRESVERCEINGYEIPAKSKVIVHAWAFGRDPKYWNEAERFNPDRFMDSSIDYKGANYEYIPFGAGRMMCPGISFGMAIVELTLAHLLYHFDWKLPSGMKHEDLDMSEAYGFSARRKKDLYQIPIPYCAPCIQ